MCGLSGFHQLQIGALQKQLLVWALGEGIDSRGGHASGFLSLANKRIRAHRKLGRWGSFDNDRFVASAAAGESLLQHARYATTAARTVRDAHPFTIKRDGRTVLHGMHNGIIYDADTSAKKHGRPYTVDSKELFELLADGDYEGIGDLHGYGVIMWVRADSPDRIYVCRLSEDSDFEVANMKGGGLVWASTLKILNGGLAVTGLEIEQLWDVEVGIVHSIHDGEISVHPSFPLTVREERVYRYSSNYLSSRGLAGTGLSSYGAYGTSYDWEDIDARWKSHFQAEEAIKSEKSDDDLEFEMMLMEEEEEKKEELCSLYGIDPKDVEDMSLRDLQDLVDVSFTSSPSKNGRSDRAAE